jgi:hypothetical protein
MAANQSRDAQKVAELRALGWSVPTGRESLRRSLVSRETLSTPPLKRPPLSHPRGSHAGSPLRLVRLLVGLEASGVEENVRLAIDGQ